MQFFENLNPSFCLIIPFKTLLLTFISVTTVAYLKWVNVGDDDDLSGRHFCDILSYNIYANIFIICLILILIFIVLSRDLIKSRLFVLNNHKRCTGYSYFAQCEMSVFNRVYGYSMSLQSIPSLYLFNIFVFITRYVLVMSAKNQFFV